MSMSNNRARAVADFINGVRDSVGQFVSEAQIDASEVFSGIFNHRVKGSKLAQQMTEEGMDDIGNLSDPSTWVVLGSGTFGTTYMATSDTGRKFAIKIIRKDTSTPLAAADQRERVEKEVAILRALRDTCKADLMCVKYAGENPQVYGIISEYLEDYVTLSKFMQGLESTKTRNPGLWSEKVDAVGHNIIKAVDHLHSLGVAHMDLKPDNILVDGSGPNGAIKIIDFGEACLKQGCDNPEVGGTLVYMAPEIIEIYATGRDSDLGLEGKQRADLFSVGLILFQLLSGESWWDTETARRAIARARLIPFVARSDRFESILWWALQQWPRELPVLDELPDQVLENPELEPLVRTMVQFLSIDPALRA